MRVRQATQVRLIGVLLVVVAAIVIILGVSQVVTARDAERSQSLTSAGSEAHLAASALSTALTDQLQVMTNLAGQPTVATLFTTDASELKGVSPDLHILYPSFTSFAFVSAHGVVLARWPTTSSIIGKDVSARPAVAGVLRASQPYISPATQQTARPYKLVVSFGAPVKATDGTLVGIIVGSVAIRTLGSFIGGTQLNGQTQLVIIDQDGHVLSGPAAGAAHSYSHLPVVRSALFGTPGSTQTRLPGYSGTRLVSYASVPRLGWAVMVEQPVSALNGPLGALTARLIGILIAVLVLLAGAALAVALLVRRLAEQHGHSSAVLLSVGDGVATLSPDGIIRSVNPAMVRLTGRTGDDLRGRLWSESVVVYDQRGRRIPTEDSLVQRALRQGEAVASEGFDRYLEQPDGSRIPVALTAAPLIVRGEAHGAVVIVRDVAREHEIDQLKSSLVSTVSHELRTPLTMIQGFSELLLDRTDLGAQRTQEALGQIHTSAERLGRLIDDLLSVSRIDAGKVAVELAPLHLDLVVGDVVAAFRTQDPHRPFEVQVNRTVAPVMADRDKLVQVLTNLVSNAVKYSPDASLIGLRARAEDTNAVVSVIDRGAGLNEEERTAIFEKFARLDRAEVRRVGGTGLGLYITRGLVQLQGGELWVESVPGSGSTFSFTIPFAPSHQAAAPDAADHPADSRHDPVTSQHA